MDENISQIQDEFKRRDNEGARVLAGVSCQLAQDFWLLDGTKSPEGIRACDSFLLLGDEASFRLQFELLHAIYAKTKCSQMRIYFYLFILFH